MEIYYNHSAVRLGTQQDQESMLEQQTKEPMGYNPSTRARLKKWTKTLEQQQEKEVQ